MKQYDLIVVGGGLSGVAAAVAAAREGLSVLLVESEGALGGALFTQSVFPFMPFATTDHAVGVRHYCSRGIFEEIRMRQQALDDSTTHSEQGFKKEAVKFVLDDLVTEAGVEVLFHATMYAVNFDGRTVRSISVTVNGETLTPEADFFVDATGDGNLLYLAGCEYQLGREEDNLCQPMTTCFDLCGVDLEQFAADRKYLQQEYEKAQQNGTLSNPRENILTFSGLDLGEGILHFNTTRVVKHNPVDPWELSRAEMIARRQVREMVAFLKSHSRAFEHATLVDVAAHIGVRESRKLVGEYVLTAEDLKQTVRFPDTVALGCYCIDIHNPEGTGTSIYEFPEGVYYNIPYRTLVPKEYDNLLVAGRCLSATQEAHSAVRIMPTCCCLGEAAGTAVAVAKYSDTNVHTVDIDTVRDRLRENGAAVD